MIPSIYTFEDHHEFKLFLDTFVLPTLETKLPVFFQKRGDRVVLTAVVHGNVSSYFRTLPLDPADIPANLFNDGPYVEFDGTVNPMRTLITTTPSFR